jgi:hypothetical protein
VVDWNKVNKHNTQISMISGSNHTYITRRQMATPTHFYHCCAGTIITHSTEVNLENMEESCLLCFSFTSRKTDTAVNHKGECFSTEPNTTEAQQFSSTWQETALHYLSLVRWFDQLLHWLLNWALTALM